MNKIKRICAKFGLLVLSPRVSRIKFIVKYFFNTLLASAAVVTIFICESAILKALFIILTSVLVVNMVILTTKRLHDINLSGWWWLLCFIPVVGQILFLALWIIPGTKGENGFGSPSKEASKLEAVLAILIIAFVVIIQIFLTFVFIMQLFMGISIMS